jgi:hypothetical protein
MTEYFLAIMLGVTVGLLILLQQRLHRMNNLLADALSDLETAAYRESVTNIRVEKILIMLSPLLEQTDWMTGRWGGQFQTLVSMENARNRAAVDIRSKLFALPFMKDYLSENKMALFTGSMQSATTGIVNGDK